ncbi:cAMP-dependent protein kinase type II regulatory subunit-like [Ctenocephalides felis]|uniref:cAMP-dependent protein kinase type II regulatory subunit-like n=1 Tax=Ctenocephalides felis TaxID=7515 RepID=UPI000E6E3400|nr:cAMP-dependent protein kinase type II regulatory subunit-like [Ctenocephalides felis]
MFAQKPPFSRSGQKLVMPKEVEILLIELVTEYFRQKPKDTIDFILEFFIAKREAIEADFLAAEELMIISQMEEEKEEEETLEPTITPPPRVRRKSVFAEAIDPEVADDDDVKVIYPKTDEQRQLLSECIKNILIFRALDEQQQLEVLDAMFEKKVYAGEVVIRQGDDGDNFYVIEKGIFRASVLVDDVDTPVYTYEGEGSFGELALLYNVPRAATVTALSDGCLWAMDRLTFRRIVLNAAFKKRKIFETLIDSVPMLSNLQAYERMNLADALVTRSFGPGECIINEGDAADGMYFVQEGMVNILITNASGQKMEVNRVGKGGYFGEMALIEHKPRAASVFAIQNVKLAFLDKATFERLLGPCMDVIKRNMELYSAVDTSSEMQSY